MKRVSIELQGQLKMPFLGLTIYTLTLTFYLKVQIHFIHFCGCFINMWAGGGSMPSIIPDSGSVLAPKQTSSNKLE